YYLSTNQYGDGFNGAFSGVGLAAMERDKMLLGQDARIVKLDLSQSHPDEFSMLPADWDGPTPPPLGAPEYVLGHQDGPPASDRLTLYQFHVDWLTPVSSTLSGPTD